VPSIDAIEGIGARSATKLRKSGIRTTEALLRRAADRKGRKQLAGDTGFTEAQLLEWANRADLMRCKGVGSEYSDLLESAGVDTIRELRRRNAASLTMKMIDINEQKRLVRRLPTEAMVARWIESATELEPIVKH
jgi:predicted flap endonuclease-1-like 5' DNA nuclease